MTERVPTFGDKVVFFYASTAGEPCEARPAVVTHATRFAGEDAYHLDLVVLMSDGVQATKRGVAHSSRRPGVGDVVFPRGTPANHGRWGWTAEDVGPFATVDVDGPEIAVERATNEAHRLLGIVAEERREELLRVMEDLQRAEDVLRFHAPNETPAQTKTRDEARTTFLAYVDQLVRLHPEAATA